MQQPRSGIVTYPISGGFLLVSETRQLNFEIGKDVPALHVPGAAKRGSSVAMARRAIGSCVGKAYFWCQLMLRCEVHADSEHVKY